MAMLITYGRLPNVAATHLSILTTHSLESPAIHTPFPKLPPSSFRVQIPIPIKCTSVSPSYSSPTSYPKKNDNLTSPQPIPSTPEPPATVVLHTETGSYTFERH